MNGPIGLIYRFVVKGEVLLSLNLERPATGNEVPQPGMTFRDLNDTLGKYIFSHHIWLSLNVGL